MLKVAVCQLGLNCDL